MARSLTPDRVGYLCHPDWTVDPAKRPPVRALARRRIDTPAGPRRNRGMVSRERLAIGLAIKPPHFTGTAITIFEGQTMSDRQATFTTSITAQIEPFNKKGVMR